MECFSKKNRDDTNQHLPWVPVLNTAPFSRTQLSAPTIQTATIGSDLSSDPPAAQQAPLTFPPLSQPPRRSVYTKVLLSRCVSDPLCHARPTSTSTDVTSLFRAPTLLVKQAKTVDTVSRSLSKQYNIPRGKLCHFRSGFDRREKRRKHVFGRKTWDLLLSRWVR